MPCSEFASHEATAAPIHHHHRAVTTAVPRKQKTKSSPPVIPNIDSRHSMECVVGMGANLGDCWTTMAWAATQLAELGQITRISPVYQTEPVGGPPQPRYLNAAVGLATRAGPLELLAALVRVERTAGRERRVRWGPRTLDLDILWIRGITVRSPDLEVPHPRLVVRPFALVPLLDVCPLAFDPATGIPYRQVLQGLSRDGVEQVGRLDSACATIG